MKTFKKIVSVFLVAICIFGMFSTASFAIDEILGGGLLGGDEDEALNYGIHYEINPLDGISVMYKPNADREFSVPSRVAVTSDVPLAVDYVCIGWRDENGNLYYAGEEIVVEGAVTLYAEWEAKSDNDPRAVRTIKTAFQTFIRMIQTFLGVFEVFETPLDELTTAPTEAPTTQKPIVVPTEPDNK